MISVRIFNAHPHHTVSRPETLHLARRVLNGEGNRAARINIIFTADRAMRSLNRKYLGKSSTTDVLSFPLGEDSGLVEGEVYINLDQARRQRIEYGATIRQETMRLVVHGILHLCGYADKSVRDRQEMTKREDKYLSSHDTRTVGQNGKITSHR